MDIQFSVKDLMVEDPRMLDLIKVYCDMGPGHDGESHILCGSCADMLLDGDEEMIDEYGEVMDWEGFSLKLDLPRDIYCHHCDSHMDEYGDDDDSGGFSDASDIAQCGYPCGDEPHGCIECSENPRRRVKDDDYLVTIDMYRKMSQNIYTLIATEALDG